MIEGYDHHSPSSLNLFAAEPAMWVLERVLGHKQPSNAPMNRGKAVEEGVTYALTHPGKSIAHCISEAQSSYDSLMALCVDPRRDSYRAGIGDMLKQAVPVLRKYGEPTSMQGLREWRPQPLKLPIIGYYDYAWAQHNILLDLKTTERMPSEIKVTHARQVALYAMNDKTDARLFYVTPKRHECLHLENVGAHRKSLLRIARTVENLLALSDDPQYFVSITVPDVDSFYWKEPHVRQLAYEIWGV